MHNTKNYTHFTPTTPSSTRFSAVIVPVLSKQQTSTRPANGILNGSVQNIARNSQLSVLKAMWVYTPNFDSATRLALTAKLSSMGNSGGTTLVIIRTQSNSNLLFFKFLSMPIKRPSHFS
jgi:hypothetical protein